MGKQANFEGFEGCDDFDFVAGTHSGEQLGAGLQWPVLEASEVSIPKRVCYPAARLGNGAFLYSFR
jgi:hypothetical protein